jgi:zinc protease
VKRAIIATFLCAATPALAQQPQPKPTAPAPAPTPPPATQKSVTPPPVEVDPWAGRDDLYKAPAITPTTKVNLGTVQRFTLPNGLKVIVVPRRSVPAVNATLAIRAGDSANPADKSGLAQFTASMLRKGTQKRSSDQIAEAIDFVGGSLDASSDDDGTLVSCSSRSKDVQLCLDLVADLTQRPAFPEGELGEIRDQLISTVESSKDNPQSLAAEHAANLFFGDDDSRGRPMSRRSIGLIDRAALVDFHKSYYAPNNAVLAISGDVDPKTIKASLTKWFGAWKKHDVPKIVDKPLPDAGKLQVRLVDKPDATQSAIVLVGPGIKHADPDFFAVRLMNFVLGGGGFSSRLMKVVRSEGGKTYGARSSFDARRTPGPFVSSTFTRNSETTSTIELVQREIAKMRESGPTDEELKAAKGNLIGGYGLRLETGGDVARALLGAELDGLDAQFVEKYPERMNAVTVAQAAKSAAAHLQPQALVIVGKADEVKPLLIKAKLADLLEVVSYTDPVSAAERKIASEEKTAAVTVSPEEADAGKKLLAVALLAKGGAALGKLKDLAMSGKGTMTVQGQSLPIAIEEMTVPGKAVRAEISVGPGKVIQVFADGKAFMREGARVVDLPPQAAVQMQRGLWRDSNVILLHASQPGVTVRALPAVTEGASHYDALSIVPPDGEATRVLLDAKTHLIARIEYSEDGKPMREDLTDYRPEAGIHFPRKVSHSGNGQSIEISYDKIEVNKGLPPDTFKR